MKRSLAHVKAVFQCLAMRYLTKIDPDHTTKPFRTPLGLRLDLPESASFGASIDQIRAFSHLTVDVGCGVGWSALAAAGLHPDRGIVAIERTSKKFELFRRRYQNHPEIASQGNLLGVQTDATHFLSKNFEPCSIDEVLFLYPNPEPKAPNQRWFRSVFFNRLLELVKVGGHIQLATNVEEYHREAVLFAANSGLEVETKNVVNRACSASIAGLPFQPRTLFEKKYFLAGNTLWLTTWTKPSRQSGLK